MFCLRPRALYIVLLDIDCMSIQTYLKIEVVASSGTYKLVSPTKEKRKKSNLLNQNNTVVILINNNYNTVVILTNLNYNTVVILTNIKCNSGYSHQHQLQLQPVTRKQPRRGAFTYPGDNRSQRCSQ